MSVPLTPSADKNWITARWACLEESMARSLTVISLLFQSTTHCRYRVYTKFLLTYTAIYRRNRKVLPLGIMALQPQSPFHLGTPYIIYSVVPAPCYNALQWIKHWEVYKGKCCFSCDLEPTALGWLKVCCYVEVLEEDELLSLLSIYGYRLAIGYFGVVKGGGVSSPSFLGGFRGWGLGLAVWTPLQEVVLIWLASRWRHYCPDSCGGCTDAQGM